MLRFLCCLVSDELSCDVYSLKSHLCLIIYHVLLMQKSTDEFVLINSTSYRSAILSNYKAIHTIFNFLKVLYEGFFFNEPKVTYTN